MNYFCYRCDAIVKNSKDKAAIQLSVHTISILFHATIFNLNERFVKSAFPLSA